jgi:light-regulated signal transduction histidine kinase (bacteriophytochrome)
VRKDGATIWASLVVTPRRDEALNVTRYIAAVQDVTVRRRMEETLVEQTEALRRWSEELEQRVGQRTAELAAANEKLRISNRELQDFASVASHDLQEPLRKILAFGDRLEARSGAALGEEGKDYLGRMKSAAARMQALISDLLAFSRVTTKAQPFVQVDLNEVAFEVLIDLEARIHETRAVIRFDPLPAVEADPVQMRQLFQNLMGNALKFRKPDVTPQIHVRAETAREEADGPAGGRYRIFVQDNGIGFDEKYLDRIFNVFQRLHGRGEYEGTGIGLAVCRKIAERHGGTITATSRPGEGSTFAVTLPLKQPLKGSDA